MPSKRIEKSRNRDAFARARRVIPGGVNSPVRAFGSAGGEPPFIASGSGAILTDLDGKQYLDYVGSWGPHLLGHAHPAIVKAVTEAARHSTSFGAPTEGETELCELIAKALKPAAVFGGRESGGNVAQRARLPAAGGAVKRARSAGAQLPGRERGPDAASPIKVRLVNSGTEATMTALRLARGVTGRDLIVKFAGCYHGHSDGLLVAAGSGALTFGQPSSAGVPADIAKLTLVLPYNDVDALDACFAKQGRKIAAVIVEPVAGNMGCVRPERGFLEALRAICSAHGALLIFDEVMTGFRLAWGGAQSLFEIEPDITALGKVVGGGMPLAAVAGKAAIMDHLAPLGPVYQAGTLSGNPVAVAAGLAALHTIHADSFLYRRLEIMSARLAFGLDEAIKAAGIEASVSRFGSMLTLFFARGPMRNLDDAMRSDTQRFARFHAGMLERGVYLPASQFEAWFVSAAHSFEQIDATIAAARDALGA